MKDTDFKFTPSVVLLPLYFVITLWIVFFIERHFKIRFSDFGIYPRELSGIKGVIFSPFLHGDLSHLFNNSLPLLFLLGSLRFFYRDHSIKVFLLGILFSGLGTWLIGRPSYHIGASGLVYVLSSFIFFKGIQTQYYRLVALSFTVIVLYGGMVWYMFPIPEIIGEKRISWEAHLSGFVVGFVFSLIFNVEKHVQPIIYEWQRTDFDPTKDAFMKHFDDDGNFVSSSKLREMEAEKWEYFVSNVPVLYEYKIKDDIA
jgi:membrane associated rhomboid family serine protease